MEVGIEYLHQTNKVEGKVISMYQITTYLMTGQFEKKVVVLFFKRRADYSLSVKDLVSMSFYPHSPTIFLMFFA
jgi:hypothetical protein